MVDSRPGIVTNKQHLIQAAVLSKKTIIKDYDQ